MVTINGETIPVSSITMIEGNYVYTSDYLKLYATTNEMEEILEKIKSI